MTLLHYAALQAVQDAREDVERCERRCDTQGLKRARRAFIQAVAWLMREERG